jgi:hypothetical protein
MTAAAMDNTRSGETRVRACCMETSLSALENPREEPF